MNRPIKFRCWDKEKKEVTIVRSWDFAHGDVEMGKELTPEAFKFEHEVELMQFTGLLDKNGKEIYEGDIIQGWEVIDLDTGIGIDSHEIETRKFTVEWDENVCGWNLYGDTKFEVIGNQFENPELLPKE